MFTAPRSGVVSNSVIHMKHARREKALAVMNNEKFQSNLISALKQ